jgi:hypothetical protein
VGCEVGYRVGGWVIVTVGERVGDSVGAAVGAAVGKIYVKNWVLVPKVSEVNHVNPPFKL